MKKLILLLLIAIAGNVNAQTKLKTENVVLITLDGFRWQELFHGADSSYFKQQPFLKVGDLKQHYWRNDLKERREALMPFFWKTIAAKGQLYGNRDYGSKVNVSNKMWFSYPGYNEILSGVADDERINSNDKNYNPNSNVLEFLNGTAKYKGRVAAFTSWDCFPYIINDKRNGIMVSSGLTGASGSKLNEREIMLNQLLTTIPNPLGDVRLDAFTFYMGMEYFKKNKPGVMYFAFDETDDFAHAGEYGAYLNAANYTDQFIGELWEYIQSTPQYRDKTTLIITADHGRGNNSEDWKHHGIKVDGADQIWLAVLGPDTKPLGEVKTPVQLYQNQIAKTLAAFLSLDYVNNKKEGQIIEAVK